MNRTTRVLMVAFLVGGASLNAANQRITIREIGTPDGTYYSIPAAINDKGVVVGTTEVRLPEGGGFSTPFLWSPRSGFDLFLNGTAGAAHDINRRGQVVGQFFGTTDARGFLWSAKEGLTDLGNFIPFSINDRGAMAGICPSMGPTIPCIWSDGDLRQLPVVSGGVAEGAAYDINRRGEVAGYVVVPQLGVRAAHWDDRGVLSVLPPLTGHEAIEAYAINDRGEMAGRVLNETSPSFAIVWGADHAIRLGPAGSTASAINAAGVAAGSHFTVGRAFVLPRDGMLIDLGAGNAHDLNDSGQVVGATWDETGNTRAVIWSVPGLRGRRP
jgi:uncharacterized membrane protein